MRYALERIASSVLASSNALTVFLFVADSRNACSSCDVSLGVLGVDASTLQFQVQEFSDLLEFGIHTRDLEDLQSGSSAMPECIRCAMQFDKCNNSFRVWSVSATHVLIFFLV